MNTDKAYLLGLIIGGGTFGNTEDVFSIRLPFKKWGSYLENPKRAQKISADIMKVVSPIFRTTYGLAVSFEASEKNWRILCEGDTSALKDDLLEYGISPVGEVKADADISKICRDLVDDNLKRRFIAGLADSTASMEKSHRRFTDNSQILSFEIKGHNYRFVCDLCRLLHSINCIPDQVAWNHPNVHAAHDPYYSTWNKGFKLRILLDQYAKFGAFAFTTKAESSIENLKLQQHKNIATPCLSKSVRATPSCIHPAENDYLLPEEIRGGHYIHYLHFCAVLDCEYAPRDKILAEFPRIGHLINPFPIKHKDELIKIEEIISSDPLMKNRNYTNFDTRVSSILAIYDNNPNELIYGVSGETGYPINVVLQSIAYIIADAHELRGKRPLGGYHDIIVRHLKENDELMISIRKPDLLTPLVIHGNGRGALIGPINPQVYKKLVSRSPNNECKWLVRPIKEEDLFDEE